MIEDSGKHQENSGSKIRKIEKWRKTGVEHSFEKMKKLGKIKTRKLSYAQYKF